jgi:hypothetical protein
MARARQKVVVRVLGIDSGFHGVANQWDVILLHDRKMLSTGDLELPLDKINTCYHLCDGMFDLESGVHLHEVVLVVGRVEDKLNGSSVKVPNSLCSCDCSISDSLSKKGVNLTRSFLDDLLVSSLDGAISLVKIDIVAMHISEDLHFDMPWLLNVLFNEHMVVTKTLHAFSLGSVQLIKELGLLHNDSHTFSTTSERCLQHHWKANLFGLFKEELRVLVISVISLYDWHISFIHNGLRLTLGAHRHDSLGWWSNESDFVILK